jgi:sodium-dependent dicarboxylate transporter 2/3/5
MNWKNYLVLFYPLLIFLPLSLGFSFSPMIVTLLVLSWMLVWWWSEQFPMGIVALLPLIIFPLFNIVSFKTLSSSYADPIIFLFLGGFMIARALEKTKLSELLALLLLRHLGKSDKGILISFVVVTSFVSMWVSNTATTMMMIPIALSVIQSIKQETDSDEKDIYNFSVALMLAISYSSSLGGVMTPVGSPPNVVFLGYLNQLGPHNLNFANWFIMVFPMAIMILTIMTIVLIYGPHRFSLNVKKINFHEIEKKFLDAKKLNFEQKLTLIIFSLTVLLWVGKDFLNTLLFESVKLDDNMTALIGGLLLFFIPTKLKTYKTVLDKNDVNFLPWDMILLFGGGLALSSVMDKTGLLEQAIYVLQADILGIGVYWKFVLLLVIVLLLTEVMSNVALCAVIIPIVMGWAKLNNLDGLHVGLMTCIVTSFGFSFPMSTPPNALVFATGCVDFKSMLKVGAILNVLAILVMATVGYYWTQLIM